MSTYGHDSANANIILSKINFIPIESKFVIESIKHETF